MSDRELVLDILSSILIAIERIERRFQYIEDADDFVSTDKGIDRQPISNSTSSTRK